MNAASAPGPIVLYDGYCPLCNVTVRILLRLDRHRRLRFAPLDGETAAAIVARHPRLEDADSFVLVRQPGAADEAVWLRSDAALRLAGIVGWPWKVFLLLRILPRGWRDGIYRWVARHRDDWFGHYERQPLPETDPDSPRFLP